jgi:glyoxylase-like metal-dependent hydrolase (beta-lactamase superfamily II)
VFPNATIWVQRLEALEARDPTNRAHGMYTGNSFDHLEALGLVREVDGDAEVAPSVRVFLTGGHSRGSQVTLIGNLPEPSLPTSTAQATPDPAGAPPPPTPSVLLHLGDLLVTHAHLSPAWVSALDDFPLETIRAKRLWLARAAQGNWWVTFSHDVTAAAGLLDAEGKLRGAWQPGRAPDAS